MKTHTLQEKLLKAAVIIAVVLYGTFLSQMLQAQSGTTSKEKMDPLLGWVGKWKGEGWSIDQSRQRIAFDVEEHIQSKLGGRTILAEGTGTNKSDGKIGFQSMGVLFYNNEKGGYEMKSWLNDGNMTLTAAEINEQGQLIWGFEVPGGKVQYTVTLTETTWNEKGEFIMPSGQAFQIMEMNLTKEK